MAYPHAIIRYLPSGLSFKYSIHFTTDAVGYGPENWFRISTDRASLILVTLDVLY